MPRRQVLDTPSRPARDATIHVAPVVVIYVHERRLLFNIRCSLASMHFIRSAVEGRVVLAQTNAHAACRRCLSKTGAAHYTTTMPGNIQTQRLREYDIMRLESARNMAKFCSAGVNSYDADAKFVRSGPSDKNLS